MKPLFRTVLISLLILMSCHKDEVISRSLFQTWEAKYFRSIESVAYPKNADKPILLTFEKDGTYHLTLDINSCIGTFKLESNDQIEMDFPACTEACCDSQFSNKLTQMLPKVTTFEIKGKSLRLNVPQWGYIELELAE